MLWRLVSVAASAAALAAGAPLHAETKSVDRASDDKVTCQYLQVVNSKIPQKICLTNFEWADRARAQEEARRSSANRNSSCDGAGGPRFPC